MNSVPVDVVVVAVIVGLMAAMLAAWWDGWFHPERYNHLELKGDKDK